MRQPQPCQGEEPLGCEESLAARGLCHVPAVSDLCSLAGERQERRGAQAGTRPVRLRAALPAPGCAPGWMQDAGSLHNRDYVRRCRFPGGVSCSQRDGIAELRVQRAVLERHFWLGSCRDVALVPRGSVSDVTGQRRPRCHGAAGSEGFLDELR